MYCRRLKLRQGQIVCYFNSVLSTPAGAVPVGAVAARDLIESPLKLTSRVVVAQCCKAGAGAVQVVLLPVWIVNYSDKITKGRENYFPPFLSFD